MLTCNNNININTYTLTNSHNKIVCCYRECSRAIKMHYYKHECPSQHTQQQFNNNFNIDLYTPPHPHTYTPTHTHTHTHKHTHTHTHTHTHKQTHTHTHTQTQTKTHTNKHTHTHTNKHRRRPLQPQLLLEDHGQAREQQRSFRRPEGTCAEIRLFLNNGWTP